MECNVPDLNPRLPGIIYNWSRPEDYYYGDVTYFSK